MPWVVRFQAGHEPVELLPGQLFYFQLISGPAKPALNFHTFIQQHKSVRFPEQSFDPVTTFSTEKIQGTSPWIHMELILYNSTQPVNGFPHIRSACYDIDFIGGCDIPNIPAPSQFEAFEPEAEDLFHLVLLDESCLQTASLTLLQKSYSFP